jgi:adenylosuccinate lyase
VSRENAYKIVQRNAMKVWKQIQDGKSPTDKDGNSLYLTYLLQDKELVENIGENKIKECFEFAYYTKNVDKIFERVFKK